MKIPSGPLDPCAGPNGSDIVLQAGDVSQLQVDGAPRFPRRHPFRDLLLDEQLPVNGELAVQIAFDLRVTKSIA